MEKMREKYQTEQLKIIQYVNTTEVLVNIF